DTGGVQVKDGAAFEITNSIIAENSASGLVGGVTLPNVPPGKPRRFQNNTVVGNRNGAGVVCAQGSGQLLQGSILFGNAGPAAQHIDCSPVTCCAPGDPMLTGTQRLISSSPCKDKLDPATSLADDIDGDARPQNGMSDCGADEFK